MLRRWRAWKEQEQERYQQKMERLNAEPPTAPSVSYAGIFFAVLLAILIAYALIKAAG